MNRSTHAGAKGTNEASRAKRRSARGQTPGLVSGGLVLAAALVSALMFGACSANTAADGSWSSPAVIADEKAMAAEKAPDFNSPQIEDKDLKVDGLPETVTWLTSKPGIFGSPRAKQGGNYRSYIPEFPQTFRTIGPNANGSFRPALGSGLDLVSMNSDTKEWMPALATHWAFAKDGMTVYFKLNEKARWTDGQPVTSADYVFMLEYMRSPHIQDPWYNETYTTQITDVKAYGDWVISVTSNAPAAPDDLLYNTIVAPRPKHFYPDGLKADWVDTAQ